MNQNQVKPWAGAFIGNKFHIPFSAVKTKNRNKASAVAGYLFADDQRGLSTPPENKETKRQKETKTMIETWSTYYPSERRTQQQITFWEPRQKFVSWWSTSLTCTRNSLFSVCFLRTLCKLGITARAISDMCIWQFFMILICLSAGATIGNIWKRWPEGKTQKKWGGFGTNQIWKSGFQRGARPT